MSATDQLTVACLGAGYFSQFHYDAWSRIEGVRTVGSADLNIAAARATGLPAFGSLGAMLEAAVPDILDIILPPPGHASAVRTAIAAGVRTVICQKPFCLDLAEAQQIVEEADKAGVTLVVHENFRFMPWYRAIRSQIKEGRIGTPMQATFRLRPGDGQGPDAYLDRQPYFQQMPRFLIHETGVHWVDTFRFIFGDPTAVYADLRQLNPVISGEDAGMVLFDHPGGVRTLLDGNRLSDHAADNLRRTMGEALFEGTTGSLSLAGDGSVSFRAFGSDICEEVLGPDPWPGFGGDCVFHLQSHVVDCLRRGKTPENTAADYLTVIRVRDAIYASAEQGRKVSM
ncbi:Gfo/Idh/MocA family oxidoreductase [uncultured Roseobacter sp.]|uniref:Gfo/Idh/MocA family protein n=1 Tax=uncultured Roseobacter sp. TaxID=114847 RepID=UPI002621A983|nr:Gfo/Idh/MocA family oxidoreductase [uncultured Roseobacter sp.]